MAVESAHETAHDAEVCQPSEAPAAIIERQRDDLTSAVEAPQAQLRDAALPFIECGAIQPIGHRTLGQSDHIAKLPQPPCNDAILLETACQQLRRLPGQPCQGARGLDAAGNTYFAI